MYNTLISLNMNAYDFIFAWVEIDFTQKGQYSNQVCYVSRAVFAITIIVWDKFPVTIRPLLITLIYVKISVILS